MGMYGWRRVRGIEGDQNLDGHKEAITITIHMRYMGYI
jgi:hypothetical protein